MARCNYWNVNLIMFQWFSILIPRMKYCYTTIKSANELSRWDAINTKGLHPDLGHKALNSVLIFLLSVQGTNMIILMQTISASTFHLSRQQPCVCLYITKFSRCFVDEAMLNRPRSYITFFMLNSVEHEI